MPVESTEETCIEEICMKKYVLFLSSKAYFHWDVAELVKSEVPSFNVSI